MSRWSHSLLVGPLAVLLMLATLPSLAIDSEPEFADPAMQARFERITNELRCLVCQNQTIADSNAGLAQDLRREVRDMMEAGASDDDIRTFMVDRYGDFVMYRPPMDARTWLLWGAPVLLLLIGAVFAGRVVLQRTNMDDEPQESSETPAA